MTSISSMLSSNKGIDSTKTMDDGPRHCAMSGDDSFYSSSDSAASTSSPTSSITSSGSGGTESDEGVFVRKKDSGLNGLSERIGTGAMKNLHTFPELLKTTTTKRPHEDDGVPMDLSCHNRSKPKPTSNGRASPVDRNAIKPTIAHVKRFIKTEPVDTYEVNGNRNVDSEYRNSFPQQANKQNRRSPIIENAKPSAKSNADVSQLAVGKSTSSHPFLPASFAYTPSLFTWPYFMPPVSATLSGLPALTPSLVGGKYVHPGLFLPPVEAETTLSSNVTAMRSQMTGVSNAATSQAIQSVSGAMQPTTAQSLLSSYSNVAPKSSQQPISISPPKPSAPAISTHRPFVNHDPALLAEFARVFGTQAGRMYSNYTRNSTVPSSDNVAATVNNTGERRRKNAKPTRVEPNSPETSATEKNLYKRNSPSLFYDLPSMVASQNGANVFLNAGHSNSLKRKSPHDNMPDFSTTSTPMNKKPKNDNHSPEMALDVWRNESSKCPLYQMDGMNDIMRQPQPVNFKPCRIPCTVCGRTYATVGALAKHAKTHDNPDSSNKFNCKICKKECTTLGALRMHIRTHTLPCECHICGKAFSRTWLLQGHIRTHTGEKPYQCTVCSRAFADRSNLRAHMQTHETIKRYSCINCEKTFSRISLLKRHQTHCNAPAVLPQSPVVA